MVKKIGFDLDGTICDIDIKGSFDDKYYRCRKLLMDTRKIAGDAEIIIITARPESMRDVTVEWLRQNNVEYDKIVILNAVMPRDGIDWKRMHAEMKAKAIIEEGVDIYYEDVPMVAEHIRRMVPSVTIHVVTGGRR